MTNNLDVYDKLRAMHKNIILILNSENIKMTEYKRMTLETVSGVLYLAEGVFSDDSELYDDCIQFDDMADVYGDEAESQDNGE